VGFAGFGDATDDASGPRAVVEPARVGRVRFRHEFGRAILCVGRGGEDGVCERVVATPHRREVLVDGPRHAVDGGHLVDGGAFAGDGAFVHGHRTALREDVPRAPALDLGDDDAPRERLACDLDRRPREVAEDVDGVGRTVDGVLAFVGDARVRRLAFGGDGDGASALVRDGDVRDARSRVPRRPLSDDRPRRRESVRDGGATALAADLLADERREREVVPRVVLARVEVGVAEREHRRGDRALHVRRPAPIDAVVLDADAVRAVVVDLRVVRRYDVVVPDERERRPVARGHVPGVREVGFVRLPGCVRRRPEREHVPVLVAQNRPGRVLPEPPLDVVACRRLVLVTRDGDEVSRQREDFALGAFDPAGPVPAVARTVVHIPNCERTPQEVSPASQKNGRMTDDADGLSPRIFLIGLCMGTADAVPGVSGGTIALLAGIYERLIDAITALTPDAGIRALRAIFTLDAATFLDVVDDTDAFFLGTLGVGIAGAIVLVSRAIHYVETHEPVALFGFFFGLIFASAIVLSRQISLDTRRHATAAAAGFVVAFAVSGTDALVGGQSLVLTFLAGMVAISATVLPGISGALILVVLGQYTYLTETLSGFVDRLLALATGGGLDRVLDPAATVLAFLAGAAIGLLTVARLVDRALEADRQTTLAFLVALVVGALRAPVHEISARDGLAWTNDILVQFVIVAAAGAVFLFALDRYAVDIDLDGTDGDVDVTVDEH